ncbi:hypothetical protein EJ08DRAFT_701724 [Tothia fuscella]|uniref:Uncharacterized protein n=1 Tax=Tothia fuscella TaxID=1048955 RepID=A0A9P4NHW2_9PEZI|nr:hypothetical protein EJ08DRAFT_701724 [Tothia fuscella]
MRNTRSADFDDSIRAFHTFLLERKSAAKFCSLDFPSSDDATLVLGWQYVDANETAIFIPGWTANYTMRPWDSSVVSVEYLSCTDRTSPQEEKQARVCGNLDLGEGCRSGSVTPFSRSDLSICHLGEPITDVDFSKENMVCVSKQGYAWGFSSYVTAVGVILEMSWIAICTLMGCHASWRSKLLRNGRPGAGLLRSVLDLAETLNRDLGTNTCAYTNEELAKGVASLPPIRYTIEDKDEGKVLHIGLVSGDAIMQKMSINPDKLYGSA